MDIRELIEFIVKALVDDPDSVEVKEIKSEQSSMIEIRAAKSDIGKIIGKQGRTITAIRAITGATATKLKKRCVVDIIE